MSGQDYNNEAVTRSAPRWAWDVIDETLAMDAKSSAFTTDLRGQIKAAIEAMRGASESTE